LSVSALLALSVSGAPSQDPAVIRVSTSLISVPVSVTDHSGNPIRDLAASDFVIEEDGNVQHIERAAEPGRTALELALLFDISGSVNDRFEFEREAAARFLKEVLRPGDAVSIFLIGPRPQQLQPRTKTVSEALESLRHITPTKKATAFYDSVVSAARSLHRGALPDSRKVQIVLSDGEDNNSNSSLLDAHRGLTHADCVFYSINPSGPSIRLNTISLNAQKGLEELASQTGGAAFLTDKPEELVAIFARISVELQAQYWLAYYSPKQELNGEFRHITVRIPTRPELRVRSRRGYYAVPTNGVRD
jgi:Ca-activated chloride channel family protein